MTISKRDFLSMGGALGAGLALPAWAQAKPLFDTINMFVPAAPGGGWDGTSGEACGGGSGGEACGEAEGKVIGVATN